jgi:hypothetical protein
MRIALMGEVGLRNVGVGEGVALLVGVPLLPVFGEVPQALSMQVSNIRRKVPAKEDILYSFMSLSFLLLVYMRRSFFSCEDMPYEYHNRITPAEISLTTSSQHLSLLSTKRESESSSWSICDRIIVFSS